MTTATQIYDRITTRLAGRRISYLVWVESEDIMAVRGVEVDRLGQEIGPIILGKSSIIKRTPMEFNDGHLRPVRNPCSRCRLSVPYRWLCIFCDRMMCDRCLADSRRCIDCKSVLRARESC